MGQRKAMSKTLRVVETEERENLNTSVNNEITFGSSKPEDYE